MITHGIKWVCLGGAALIVLIIVAVLAIGGTEAGTRFLVNQAKVLLPEELRFDDIRGTLASSVQFENVVWSDDAAFVEVDQVELEIGLRYLLQPALRIDKARVKNVTVRVLDRPNTTPDAPFSLTLPVVVDVANLVVSELHLMSGEVDRRIQRIEIDGRIKGDQLTVRRLSVRADGLNGNADGELELRPPYTMRAAVDWVIVANNAESFAGKGTVTGTPASYAVRHALTLPYLIASEGSLSWTDTFDFDIQNTWAKLSIPVDGGEPISSDAGRVDLVGSTTGFSFDLKASALLPPGIQTNVSASGVGDIDRLTIDTVRLVTERGSATASGPIELSAAGLTWQADVDIEQLELAALAADIDGILNLRGQSAGRMDQWESVEAAVNIDRMTGSLFGRPLTGSGSIDVADEIATFSDLILEVGENRLELNGKWGKELNLMANIQANRLELLLPTAAGKLAGAVAIGGSLDNPVVDAQLSGEQLVYNDIRADTLTLTSGSTNFPQQSIDIEARDVGAGDTRLDSLMISLRGSLPSHEIAVTAALADQRLDMQIQATYEPVVWAGLIQSARLWLGENEQWAMASPATFRFDNVSQRISSFCMEGATEKKVCAEFAGNLPDDTQAITVAVESFPIGELIEMAEPQLLANGELFADLQLNRMAGDYNGSFSGRVDALELGLRRSPDRDDLTPPAADDTVTLGWQFNSAIATNRMNLTTSLSVNDSETASGTMSVVDVRDITSDLAASVDVVMEDLGFVSWFWEQFDISGGEVAANLTARGSLAEPQLMGGLQVTDAEVFIPASGVTYKAIKLNAVATDSTKINFEGAAESAGGGLQLSGTTVVDMAAGWPTEIDISGQDVELVRYPEWSVFASPDLKLLATSEAAQVSGTVTIPRAKIVLDTVPETAQSPSPDAVIHSTEQSASGSAYNYDFDVKISLGDDVKLEGFGLDTYLAGSLDMTGGLRKPLRGNGELSLRKGTFDAYGQVLAIERGLILFVGPLENPLLDIRATREVDTISVGILVNGAANQPQSTLFSDPAMSEASILSYLITGQPLPEAGDEDGDRISGAAIALGLSQANNIVSEVSATLGLDELSIEGGSTDGRILAGKRLSSKLYLRYAYGVFDSIGNLLLRYRLNDRFAIESESGEEQSLDIVYSVDME